MTQELSISQWKDKTNIHLQQKWALIFFIVFHAGRYINQLTYADNTTLMAESEEELKSLLMRVKKKSEKVVLKFNIQKT